MPLESTILTDLGVVVVRFWGHVIMSESLENYQETAARPGFDPSMRFFMDFSEVQTFDEDIPGFLQLQARLAESFARPPSPPLVVFWAPTPVAVKMALKVRKSWDGAADHAIRIISDRSEALALVGLSERQLPPVT